MPLIDGEEWGGGFNVGDAHVTWQRWDLNDDEITEEIESLQEREARRVPMGFRHGHAATTDETPWPDVPRFDVIHRHARPVEKLGWQTTIDGGEVPHSQVRP
jgi:hypothetical protein